MPNSIANAARLSLTRLIAAAAALCCLSSANVLPSVAFAHASTVEAKDAGELLVLRVSEALSLGTQETAKRLARIGFSEEVEQLRTVDGYRHSSFSSRTLVESLYRRAELQSAGEGERFLAVLYRDAAKDSQALAKDPEFESLREYIRRSSWRLNHRRYPIRFAPPSELASVERIPLSPAADRAIASIADIYSGPHLGRMRLLALQTFRNKFDNAAFERAIADARSTREAIELMVQRGTPPPTVERALIEILKGSAAKLALASPEVLEAMTNLDPHRYRDKEHFKYVLEGEADKRDPYPKLLEEMMELVREETARRIDVTKEVWEKAKRAIQRGGPILSEPPQRRTFYERQLSPELLQESERSTALWARRKEARGNARPLEKESFPEVSAREFVDNTVAFIEATDDPALRRRIIDEVWQTDWFRSLAQLVELYEKRSGLPRERMQKLRQMVNGPAPDLRPNDLAAAWTERRLLYDITAKLADHKSYLRDPRGYMVRHSNLRLSEYWRKYVRTRGRLGGRSDRRLKAAIEPVGTTFEGLMLYRFHYKGENQCLVGLMAQDLLKKSEYHHALIIDQAGYYHIDYASLGLRMATCEEWRAHFLEAVRASESTSALP